MKHLLTGVAMAAALAIAAPAWAQNAPMSPSSPTMPKAASTAKAGGAAAKHHHHRAMRHTKAMHHHGKSMHHGRMMSRSSSPDNAMTEQLNREELARIQSGSSTMPTGAPHAGMGHTGGPAPMHAPAGRH